MGTQLPSPKKGAEPPIFGPCLLWLNGCMHQDTTWYGGSRQPRRHCVRWCSPSPKGAQPPNCRQMSVVAKRLDGLKCRLVWSGPSLGPSDFVFDGDTPPPEKRHSPPPNFYAQILSTEASFYIYDRPLTDINVIASVCASENLRIKI